MAETTAPRAVLSFLLCAFLTPGQGYVTVFYHDQVEADPGHQVSLPCVTEPQEGMSVTQLEWRKKGDPVDQKLVVFAPRVESPHFFWPNVSLKLVKNESGELRGSYLELHGVQRSDSGVYLCDLTVYPQGPISRQTRLRVKVPPLSVGVAPLGPVNEGEEVRISCHIDPKPVGYKLSKNNSSALWSANGTFVLENVTRESTGVYSCQPQWASDVPRLHDNQGTVSLHVSYLDHIECDRNGAIEVGAGDNVTIHCNALASSDARYRWTKDDQWVSDGGSLELWRVRGDQTGVYTLSVSTQSNHSLQRKFTITLLPATRGPDTEAVKTGLSTPHSARDDQNQTGTEASPTPTMSPSTGQTNNSISQATQPGPDLSVVTLDTSTQGSKVNHSFTQTPTLIQSNYTRQPSDQSEPASSSTGDFESNDWSTLLPEGVSGSGDEGSDEYSDDGQSTTESDPERSPPESDTATNEVIVEQDLSDGRSHLAWIILLFLALLLIGVFVYRRRVLRKRMDLPPPFKPPPPPQRYAPLRGLPIHVTKEA